MASMARAATLSGTRSTACRRCGIARPASPRASASWPLSIWTCAGVAPSLSARSMSGRAASKSPLIADANAASSVCCLLSCWICRCAPAGSSRGQQPGQRHRREDACQRRGQRRSAPHPFDRALNRPRPPGGDGEAVDVAAQVVGHRAGRLVAPVGVLLQRLQADRLQVHRHLAC